MTFTPVSLFSFGPLRGIDTLAYASVGGGSFLLTGGADAFIFHLNGNNIGCAGPLINIGSQFGAIFPGIEIEVDLASSYRPAFIRQPIGAIVITDSFKSITFLRQGSGFGQMGQAILGDPAAEHAAYDGNSIGFKSWRVTKRDGEEKIELATFTASAEADF